MALVGHLAWPSVVLVGLLLVRREIRAIAERLAARIGSEGTDVTLGREGIQIRQRAAPADQVRERILRKLQEDEAFEPRLKRWLDDQGVAISTTLFLYGSLYESLREAAAAELLEAPPTGREDDGAGADRNLD